MFSILINPLSALVSFSAMFGVFIHDTQIYNMTAVAIVAPGINSSSLKEIGLVKVEQHAHPAVSSVSVVSVAQQTSIQPRSENDKKYVSQRRRFNNDFDNGYRWPSI